MASEKTLNVKNIAALGAERLAELLLELATGDAAAKRRLRLELASRSGSGDVATEIRKRLTAIAKSRSFIDWRKIKALAQDLDTQRAAIMAHVAPTAPAHAFDLLWRLLEMAPALYARCDDSNGTIGSVIGMARTDLGTVAGPAKLDPDKLADRVFQGVCDNDYAQFDGLIGLMAEPLGQEGLNFLKIMFKELATKPPTKAASGARRIIGMGTGGPIYQDDYEIRRHASLVQAALAEIADALGDVDGYAACFSAEERANPAIASRIAKRLLAANRAEDAMHMIAGAEINFNKGGSWPDWQRVRIEVLDASGRAAEAQDERWAIFERGLNAEYLRAYIKRLPDFDDEEAEIRALAHVRQHSNFDQALAFLVDWPAHGLAAELVVARHDELDGDHYWLLTPAADALEQRHPLAATLMLRAMIDFSLNKARTQRYGHAARHLRTCEILAKRIDSFGDHSNHEAYLAGLRLRHGRKSGFWHA
jgi:hypothetical protein